ncbi:MAG TPA: diguanylate cyclase [Paucimonas sp.]|nr:diguanylate cyclase [Paucimonas sp.]
MTSLVIGLFGLAGLVLWIADGALPSSFQEISRHYLIAPAALGMAVLGLGLWSVLRRAAAEHPAPDFQERRITRTAIVVLTGVTLATGLAGFTILRQGFDEEIAENVLLIARTTAGSIRNSLEQRFALAGTIALRPGLQRYLLSLENKPGDAATLALIKEIGDSFSTVGVTGIRFFDASGRPLTASGEMRRRAATLDIRLGTPAQYTASLFHAGGFYLHTGLDVVKDGKIIGKLEIEQSLELMPALFDEVRQRGESFDMLLCGRERDIARCFGTRFHERDTRMPLYDADGAPNQAIGRALHGLSGVASFRDARGVDVLAGYSPAGTLDLGIAINVDSRELYASFRQRLYVLAAILAALVGIGTAILRLQVYPLAASLRKAQRRLQVILDSANEAFVGMDRDGIITDWNENAVRIFGWTKEEAIGRPMAELIIPPSLRETHERGKARYLSTGLSTVLNQRLELTALRRDGEEFPVEITIGMTGLDDNVAFSAFMHDISARQRREADLRQSRQQLRMVADNMPALISYVDVNQRFLFSNRTFYDWFDRSPEQIPDCTIKDFLGDDGYREALPYIERALGGEKVTFERTHVDRAGRVRHNEATYLPDFDDSGRVRGMYVMVLDITQRTLMEQKLYEQATHDALTGLPNRSELTSRLEQAVQRINRSGQELAIMFLDLDGFKSVNDTLGHHAGDELLREFAERLKSAVRKSDTVARWAGDEFIVILEKSTLSIDAVHAVARKIMKAMEQPFACGGGRIVSTSIGIAFFKRGQESASEFISRADAAMYVAKRNGKNQYAFA